MHSDAQFAGSSSVNFVFLLLARQSKQVFFALTRASVPAHVEMMGSSFPISHVLTQIHHFNSYKKERNKQTNKQNKIKHIFISCKSNPLHIFCISTHPRISQTLTPFQHIDILCITSFFRLKKRLALNFFLFVAIL